jgi:hypothetical protein
MVTDTKSADYSGPQNSDSVLRCIQEQKSNAMKGQNHERNTKTALSSIQSQSGA